MWSILQPAVLLAILVVAPGAVLVARADARGRDGLIAWEKIKRRALTIALGLRRMCCVRIAKQGTAQSPRLERGRKYSSALAYRRIPCW